MSKSSKPKRFIFKTNGVCPPEIHFQVDQNRLNEIQFIGGGCPGNARLVSRLLSGLPIHEVLQRVSGIDCRNGTSCPDQLATALKAHYRVGLIGDLAGKPDVFQKIADSMTAAAVDATYCIGNVSGDTTQEEVNRLLRLARSHAFVFNQGENDWRLANEKNNRKICDWLIQLPQVSSFKLGSKNCMAFFGQYILNLPGFSDFEPFALEMNMVCGLTNFMQDNEVFPALEAMTPQFQTDVVIFSQTKQWGHWRIGDKHFVSVGPAADSNMVSWGMLAFVDGDVRLDIMRVD
jgi:uncharacterized protein (TIGR03905 family)